MANNAPGGGFYAQGSAKFVAGAAIGAAIGQGIKAQNNYNACMEATGWEVADQPRAIPAPYTSSSAPPNYTYQSVAPSYTGEMKDGKREGHGTLVWADGSKYVGDFKNDVRSGHGEWTNAKGDHYEGEWADDRRNGFGIATQSALGGDDRGIWKDGVLVKRQTAPD